MSSNFNARDAQAYDSMMGRWSARLAPKFIAHAGVGDGERVLDLGCGTGNVSFAMPAGIGSVVGVDYSPIYVAAAQHRNTRPNISIEQGDGNALRFDDDSFDRAVSMLVIQHVPDPLRVLSEMRRVTKPGGVVACAVWDSFGGMGAHRMLWDTAAVTDPDALRRRAKSMNRPAAQPGGLPRLFAEAGLRDIDATELMVRWDFADFADYWEPMLQGEGSVGDYITSLSDEARIELSERLRVAYVAGGVDGPRSFAAVAWSVRGVVA
jgi:SAM-dependent methyltransferase